MHKFARWFMRLFYWLLILASTTAAVLAAVWGWFVVSTPSENFHDQGGMFITLGVAFFVVAGGALALGWAAWAAFRAIGIGRCSADTIPGASSADSGVSLTFCLRFSLLGVTECFYYPHGLHRCFL